MRRLLSVCFNIEALTAVSLSVVQELVDIFYETETNGHSGNYFEKHTSMLVY